MPNIPPTVEVIAALLLFSSAILLGVVNQVHVVRQDLVENWGRRSLLPAVSQGVLLVCYVLSFVNGYMYIVQGFPEDIQIWDHQYHLSDGFFVLGSFLLVLSVQALLPAVQIRMQYRKRWNTLLYGLTWSCFAVSFGGYIVMTIVIAYRRSHSLPSLPSLADARTGLFTLWALYAPLWLTVISILVIRMVIAVKKTITMVGMSGGLAPDVEHGDDSPGAILDHIKTGAIRSAAVAIPCTIVVAGSTAFPYSVALDGLATLYTAMFSTWLLYNVHIIRQVVLYSPSPDRPDTTHSGKRLRGLAAVEASNRSKCSDTESSRKGTKSSRGGGNSSSDVLGSLGALPNLPSNSYKDNFRRPTPYDPLGDILREPDSAVADTPGTFRDTLFVLDPQFLESPHIA